jgi:hypothetical protein
MGGGESSADLDRPFNGFARDDRSALQPLPQRLALEQLEHGVARPVVSAEIVDGEDVGVIEGGDGASLPLEAADAVRVAAAVGGDDLDRDVAPEAGVSGPVDLAHPPRPDGGHDLVRAQSSARLHWHCRGPGEILDPRPSAVQRSAPPRL